MLAFLFSLVVAAGVFALVPSAFADEGAPVLTVLSEDASGLTVRLTVADIRRGRSDGFDTLTLPGESFVGEIGRPMLPSVRRLIRLPARSGFRATVRRASYDEIEGVTVLPQQNFVTDNDVPPPFVIDAETYARDAWFPARAVEVRDPSIYGGLRVAALALNPVQYNPVRGTVRVARELEVRIDFAGQDLRNALPEDPRGFGARRRNLFERSVLNFRDEGRVRSAAATGDTTLLIVTEDDYADHASLAELIGVYESEGQIVETLTISDIGSHEGEDIRQAILNVYEAVSPPALDYVLFVGDVGLEHIPLLIGPMGYSGDAPYALLDGDDALPDVAMGRLAAKSTDHLTHLLEKTLAWKNGGLVGEWMSKSLLVAHKQGYPDKYTAVDEAIRTYAYSLTPPLFATQYGGAGATNETLIDEINDGYFLVNYRGHGNAFAWISWSYTSEYFTTDEALALTNVGMPFILFSVACDNADLTQDGPSLAEAFMDADNGAGAVLGSVHSSFTVPNHEFDKFLYRAVYDDGIDKLGDILVKANGDLMTYFTGDEVYEAYTKKNIEMFLWLGDPTITVPISGIFGPTNLRASPNDETSIALTWTDRSTDENSFVLEAADDYSGPWEVAQTLPADTTETMYSGLTEAQRKFFRIKSVTDEGDSYYTNAVEGQTLAEAPDGLAASATAIDKILVEWSDNSSGEIAYRVLRKGPADADYVQVALADPDAVSYEDSGLAEGTVYEYTVEAVTIGGESRATTPAETITLPAAPSNLQAFSGDDLSVTLVWEDRSGGEDGFRIYRKNTGDADWTEIGEAAAEAETYVDETADEGAELLYAVAAFNAGGVGPMSEPCAAAVVPQAPEGLAASPISPYSVALFWQDQSGAEEGYLVSRSLDDVSWSDLAELPPDTLIFVDAGLSEGMLVTYRITAQNAAGESAASNEATTRTLPLRPTDLAAEESEFGVLLSWDDNSDAETGYRVERSTGGGSFAEIASIGANETGYMDASGSSDARYRVAAFHEYGLSEYSNTAVPGETVDDAADDTDDDDAPAPSSGGDDDDDSGGCCG